MWKLVCLAGEHARGLRLPVAGGLGPDDWEAAKKLALFELSRVVVPQQPRLVWTQNQQGREEELASYPLE